MLTNRTPLLRMTLLAALSLCLAGRPEARAESFDQRVKQWQARYGNQAPLKLLELARNRTLPESQRYFAVLAATRLGGQGVAASLSEFFKDKSWLIRSAALQSALILQAKSLGPEVLRLLKDPALVIRSAAVEVVERLGPRGAGRALASAASDPSNYHHGKAQWVPQKALRALQSLSDRSVAPLLGSLLKDGHDPEIQKLAVDTLDRLYGVTAKPEVTLAARVREWRLKLASQPKT